MSKLTDKIMKPLWMEYPEYERYSLGWRMGAGEDYAGSFWGWFEALPESDKKEYMELFPEPITWKGFWDDKDDNTQFYIKNDFVTFFWNNERKAKYSVQKIINSKSKFVMFWGHTTASFGNIGNNVFSQWWKQNFLEETVNYNCMEQYMMSKKALLFDDKEVNDMIMNESNPKRIKALGRNVRNFDEALWDELKYTIVLNGNWRKFSQNKDLRDYLISTKDKILVEASPYDNIWGIGMSAQDEHADCADKWKGTNLLGFALTEVRDELRRVWKNENLF